MEQEIEHQENLEVIDVIPQSEQCPYCGESIPLGLLSEHIPVCEKRPQEKIVIKEVIREDRVPDYRPLPGSDYWTTKNWVMSKPSTTTGHVQMDVRVSRGRYSSCSQGKSSYARS